MDERVLAMLHEFRASAVALYGDDFVELRARQRPLDPEFADDPPGVEVTVILRDPFDAADFSRISAMLSRRASAANTFYELDVRAVKDWDPAGEVARCTVPIAA